MAVHIFSNKTEINENTINDSYALYLQNFIEGCEEEYIANMLKSCAIMSHDEFKEYFILKVLGRSSEFTKNIARDYQVGNLY